MFVFCIECPYCVDISLDIVGEWPFGCLPEPVLLKEPILIPRPETEELVEHIRNQYEADMQSMGEQGGRDFCFLEVGSGTGVISLSLLEKNPSWRGVTIDINPTAVELTCANAARMGVSSRLTVLHMDALQPDINVCCVCVCALCVLCVLCACSECALCMLCVYSVCVLYVCCVCALCVLCVLCVCPLCVLCVRSSVCVLCVCCVCVCVCFVYAL